MSVSRFFGRRMSSQSNFSGADGSSSSEDDSGGGTGNMMELHNSTTFSDLAFKKSFADVSSKSPATSYGHDSAGSSSSEYSSSASSASSHGSPVKQLSNGKQQASSSKQGTTDWSAFDESFGEPPSQSDGLTGIDTLDPLTGRPIHKPIPTRARSNPNLARRRPPPAPIVRNSSAKQVARPKPLPAVSETRNAHFDAGSHSMSDSESESEPPEQGQTLIGHQAVDPRTGRPLPRQDSMRSKESRESSSRTGRPLPRQDSTRSKGSRESKIRPTAPIKLVPSDSESESEPPEQGQTLIGHQAVDPRTGRPLPRQDSMRSKESRESITAPIILVPVRQATPPQTPAVTTNQQRPTNGISNRTGGKPNNNSNHSDDESSYSSSGSEGSEGSDYESEVEPPEQDDGLTGINTIDPLTGRPISKPIMHIRANERTVRPATNKGSNLRQTYPAASQPAAPRQSTSQSTSSAPPNHTTALERRKNQVSTQRQDDQALSKYSSGSGSEYETGSGSEYETESGSEYETGSGSEYETESGSEYETETDYTSSTAGDGLQKSSKKDESSDEEGKAIMKHIMGNTIDSINDPGEDSDSRPQRSTVQTRVAQKVLQDSISDPNEEDGTQINVTLHQPATKRESILDPDLMKDNISQINATLHQPATKRESESILDPDLMNDTMSQTNVTLHQPPKRNLRPLVTKQQHPVSTNQKDLAESILDPDLMNNTMSQANFDMPPKHSPRISRSQSAPKQDMTTAAEADTALDPLQKRGSLAKHFSRSDLHPEIAAPKATSTVSGSGAARAGDAEETDSENSGSSYETGSSYTDESGSSEESKSEEGDASSQDREPGSVDFGDEGSMQSNVFPQPKEALKVVAESESEEEAEPDTDEYSDNESITPHDIFGLPEEEKLGGSASDDNDVEPDTDEFSDGESIAAHEVFGLSANYDKVESSSESDEDDEPDTDEFSDNESLDANEMLGIEKKETPVESDEDVEPDTDEYSDNESLDANEMLGIEKQETPIESDEDVEPDTDEYSDNESLDAHEMLGIEKQETQPLPPPPRISPPEVRPPPERALSEISLDAFEVFTKKKKIAPPKRPVPVRQDSYRSQTSGSSSGDIEPSSDEFSDEESISESEVFDECHIEPADKDDYSNEGSLSEVDVFDEEDIEPESEDEYGAENSMSETSVFDGEDIEPATPEGSKEGSLSNGSLFGPEGPEDSATENDSLDGEVSMQVNIHVIEDIPGKYASETGSLLSKRKNETKPRKEASSESKEGGPFDSDSLDGEVSIQEHATIVQGIPGQPAHVPIIRRPKPQKQDTARFSYQESKNTRVTKYKVPTQSNGGADVMEQNTPDKLAHESRPSKPHMQDTARLSKKSAKDIQGTKSNPTRQNDESSDAKEQTMESNGGGGVFGRWFGTKNTKDDENGKIQNADSSPKDSATEHDSTQNGDAATWSNDPLALKNDDVAGPLLGPTSGSAYAEQPDLMSSVAYMGDMNRLDLHVSDYADGYLAPIEELSDEESSRRSLGSSMRSHSKKMGKILPPAILEEDASSDNRQNEKGRIEKKSRNSKNDNKSGRRSDLEKKAKTAETDTVNEIVHGVSGDRDSLTITGKSTKSSSSGILPSELSGETAIKKGSDSLDGKEAKSTESSGSSSRYRSKRKKQLKEQERKRSTSSIDQSLLKADQSPTPNGSSDKVKKANAHDPLKRRTSSKFATLKPLTAELSTEEMLKAEKREQKALLRRSSRSLHGLRKLSSLNSLGIREFSPSTFVRPVANTAGESESSIHSKLKQEALQSLDVIEKDYALDSRRLSPSDSVLIINGWNRRQPCHIFLDALLARWRILVAFDELVSIEEARNNQLLSPETKRALYFESINLVDDNADPISKCLGARMSDVKRLLLQMLDYEIKSLHSQTHMGGNMNSAYIPFRDHRDSKLMIKNEPVTLDDSLGERFRVLSRHGIRPIYWVLFCDAFLWSFQNHNPRKNTADFDDLAKPPTQSAYAYFVSSKIAKRAIEEQLYLREQLAAANVATSVKQTWGKVGSTSSEKIYFCENFLKQLLTNCPELRRYFGKVDMDTVPIHFARTMDIFMANIDAIGSGTFDVQKASYELSSILLEHDIPYLLLPVFGWQLIKSFAPFFKQEEKRTKDKKNHIKADALKCSFAFLYSEVMDVVSQSIIFRRKLVTEATLFIYCVAAELDWAADVVAKRLVEVKEEIKITGTYTHTSEEIESGARIAWRNSSQVPGCEDWKSFEVRDYRKMETPDRIFSAVEEYLNKAKSGTKVRSILAVFKPKSPNYAYGTRFWSPNFINYAGYQDRQGVIGDPETLEFTEFLIKNKLWSPPQKRSEYDILPLVLKMAGEQKPYIHKISKESSHEVAIEHPVFKKIRQLGLRCTGFSAISNKSLNIGGLEYQCCPFNGYSISSQVAQKLLKRNGVYEKLAKAMNIAMSERMYKKKVEHELQIAILHSFERAGYAILDPEEVDAAFSKHCENERLEGRECLSQHPIASTDSPPSISIGKSDSSYEPPQFESLCMHWWTMDGPYYSLTDMKYTKSRMPAKKSTGKESESYSRDFQRPLVLIAFDSEIGDAESVALRLGHALRTCKPIVKSLDDVKRLNMLTEHQITHFIVLCGTGDNGGSPLVAQSFASASFATDLLKNVKVTVLAFGSTLYPNFCQVGKELEETLISAGSNAFLPLTTVNGVLGFESFVSDWLGLVKRIVLPEYIQAALSVNVIADRRPSHKMTWLGYVQPTGSIEQFDWPEKSASICKKNDELIVDGSMTGRSTRRLTFKLPQGMSYETGDHLSVHPLNPLPLIQRFAACFEDELLAAAAKTGEYPFPRSTKLGNQVRSLWQMDQPFNIERIENGISIPTQVRFKTPSTLSDVLQAHVELILLAHELFDTLVLLRRLLNLAVPSTTSAILKNEFEGKDAEAVNEFDRQSYAIIFGEGREKEAAITSFLGQYPTIVDLLESFKTLLCCRRPVLPHDDGNPRLSLGNLLAVLPPLRTRTYTISSSSKIDSSKVSITVAVLRSTAANGVKIDGVCSNYLARLRPNKDRAKIWVKPSSFRGPKGTKSPVIYIGAGTGLSGIMGFLKDRVNTMKKANGEAGECHLFFGCRSIEDRIYAKYIDTWEKQGVLKLHLAFSRAPFTSRTHIPNIMNKFGPELCKLLLQDNTLYYICGDSKVARDCYEACVHVLQEYGNLSRASSVQHLNCMREEGRWRCDLWGVMYHFNSTKSSLRRAALLPAESWLRKFPQRSTKSHHGENKQK